MDFIELLKVIVLGIVEGVTEWLPISSTGHMILVDEFIKLNMSAKFMEMFLVVIQLGAIMAVVVLYFEKLNPFSARKNRREKRQTISLWCKVVVACVPAAVIGLAFNDYMEEHFFNAHVVAATLIFYGILFILIENRNRYRRPSVRTLEELSYGTAIMIGIFQVLSLVPGTSRSGSTIIGAILIGSSRQVAAEFTFFLAIPVMFGASLLKMLKFGFAYTGAEMLALGVGSLVAFIVSILSIKFLVGYIKTNDFKAFGWYRIILGVLILGYFFIFGD